MKIINIHKLTHIKIVHLISFTIWGGNPKLRHAICRALCYLWATAAILHHSNLGHLHAVQPCSPSCVGQSSFTSLHQQCCAIMATCSTLGNHFLKPFVLRSKTCITKRVYIIYIKQRIIVKVMFNIETL